MPTPRTSWILAATPMLVIALGCGADDESEPVASQGDPSHGSAKGQHGGDAGSATPAAPPTAGDAAPNVDGGSPAAPALPCDQRWQPDGVDVTKFGVVGDGVTDNASALQALLDSQPNGTLFYFPPGSYRVSRTIHFYQPDFGVVGALKADCTPASVLESDTPDVTVASADYEPGAGSFQIRNMEFRASNQGGTGFYSGNAASATIEDSAFSGHIGLYQHYAFVVALRSVQFKGDGGANGSHIGYQAFGQTESLVESCTFSGWDEGARFGGAGMSIVGSTFERNKIGLQMGLDPNGSAWIEHYSSLNDVTFTDNDLALKAGSPAGVAMSNIKIHGSTNAPSGQSSVGLHADYAQQSTFSDLHIDGSFSDTAVRITNSQRGSFLHNDVVNTNSSGKLWDVAQGMPGVIQDPALLPGQVSFTGLPHTWVFAKSANVVDVTAHGVVGDNSTDNAAAIQSMIDGASNGTIFYFPRGIYRVTKTLDFSKLTDFGIVGDGKAIGGSTDSTTLWAFGSTPLIKVAYPASGGTFHIRDMYLRADSTVLDSQNAVDSTIDNVEVSGNDGLRFENPVRVRLRSLNFDAPFDIRGVSLTGNNHVAISLSGGHDNTLEQVDVLGWQEAVRATGDRLTIFASRFEVNHTALNLGVAPDGSIGSLTNSTFSGMTFEANDTAIDLASCQTCFLSALGGQGSSNAPTGPHSAAGIRVGASVDVTFSAAEMVGDFTEGALIVSPAAQRIIFSDTGTANNSGPARVIQNSSTTFKN